MFAVCGVSDDKFRGVCLVVDKLDKVINRSRCFVNKVLIYVIKESNYEICLLNYWLLN